MNEKFVIEQSSLDLILHYFQNLHAVTMYANAEISTNREQFWQVWVVYIESHLQVQAHGIKYELCHKFTVPQ